MTLHSAQQNRQKHRKEDISYHWHLEDWKTLPSPSRIDWSPPYVHFFVPLVSLVSLTRIPFGNPTTLVGCQGHSAESWAVVSVCQWPVNATKFQFLNKKTLCETKHRRIIFNRIMLLHFSPVPITQSKDATSMINKLWFGRTVGHVQTISAMALPVSWPVHSSVVTSLRLAVLQFDVQ